MHGLINKSVQMFLRDHHGISVWKQVAERVGLEHAGFEAMLHYADSSTEALLAAAQEVLGVPRAALLEDIGAWVAMSEPLRRLLRFGGADFGDFLHSLDDLPGRGRMALPDLDLPELVLQCESRGRFVLHLRSLMPGWSAVMAGLLRAMADDYGALVLIEPMTSISAFGAVGQVERLRVLLLDEEFSAGRQFELAPEERRGAP